VKETAESAGLKAGWRSGLEEQVSQELHRVGTLFSYEELTLSFLQPSKPRKYTPDFLLAKQGFIVETKGRFVTADRQKHILVKEQHPDLEIRFLFSNPNARISKTSKTTYAMWCDKHGFRYAKSFPKAPFPLAWLDEPCNTASLAAITRLLGE
jgi:Phage endonuclease I